MKEMRGSRAAPATYLRAAERHRRSVDNAIEIAEERYGVIVIRVARAEEQGDPAAADRAAECRNCRLLIIELGVIPLSELRPSGRRRIVIEPTTQRDAG